MDKQSVLIGALENFNKAGKQFINVGEVLSKVEIAYQASYDDALLKSLAPSADKREAEARRFCREKGLEDDKEKAKVLFYGGKSLYEMAKENLETFRVIERTK